MQTSLPRTRCVRFIVGATAALASVVPSTWAFSVIQANDLMEAHKNAFYVHNNGSGYHRKSTADGSRLDFWKQAELIETTIDAYKRTGKSNYLDMFNSLLDGFSSYYGTNWSSNEYNDDIMWASIAYARAYLITGNTTYRTIAKTNFDLAYARAWDTSAGGLWWTTGKTSKNSCVNFPGAIAAYLLYKAYDQSSYLTKSQAIFDWGKANLWDSTTGKVYDTLTNQGATSYNQGTFVGAANFLNDVSAATLAANYTRNSMGSIHPTYGERMLPQYDSANNSDLGGFNGICYRWIAKFVDERNLQGTFGAWLQANGDASWTNRRTSDNLSWSKTLTATPSGEMWAWGCSSPVNCLQVVPASYISEQTYILKNRKSGLVAATSGGATANNTPLVQAAYTGANSMRWSVTDLGNSQYYLTNVASGRAMSINNASQDDDAIAKIYDYFGGNQQKVTFYGRHACYYSILFVHSGKALQVLSWSTAEGAQLVQYTHADTDASQWSLWVP